MTYLQMHAVHQFWPEMNSISTTIMFNPVCLFYIHVLIMFVYFIPTGALITLMLKQYNVTLKSIKIIKKVKKYINIL